jgi:L-alanine-DL-glutamate epimerase-like enolase superfamily enzyme
MADESVWTRRQLLELLALGRVGYVNIKLAKTGGMREALALAELARAHDLAVVVGCMLESHVGISAAASFAAAVSGAGAAAVNDLDGGLWFAESPVSGGARYEGPRIVLPDAPGFGITGLR